MLRQEGRESLDAGFKALSPLALAEFQIAARSENKPSSSSSPASCLQLCDADDFSAVEQRLAISNCELLGVTNAPVPTPAARVGHPIGKPRKWENLENVLLC